MSINYPKVILAALVGFCFWVSFERCRDFYITNVPIGKQGSCFLIQFPDYSNRYQMKILKNSFDDKGSLVQISLLNNSSMAWNDNFTYFQQRMLNPKTMVCRW